MSAKKILVVDDNDVNCFVAESMLKMLGYSTFIAKSGKEAIVHSDETTFDMILMDWQMPEMNGFDTATLIWKNSKLNQNTKMIAVTANAFQDDREACLKHGFVAVLTKPFDVDQLGDLLSKHLV